MSTRLKGARTPLLEVADYFDSKTAMSFTDCVTPTEAKHFFHGKLTKPASLRLYSVFVRMCATVPNRDDDWLDSAARGFARRLVAIMVTQAHLEDHVALASMTPFYGFPSPHEILTGEKCG